MNKVLIPLIFLALFTSACVEVEEISGGCEVYLKRADGSTWFYEIKEDVRRNKDTGVFTYRDENGKLWSINQDEEGKWWSKSTEENPVEVERIVCGEKVYLEEEQEEAG
ncbi:hypothetical protein [Fontibacter flavus]|uniref:Uncharacterized protein n=1 Tax=Fontibacter flavus TaxID=654838 RepID=A0ABV6FWQ3_9BACT|nr:hypothetical protein [Cyclobacteriaceae bacterium]